MDFFVWKDEYTLGNEHIDAQHRMLIKMLNDLAEAGPDNNEEGAYKCLSRMGKYAEEHFCAEEELMRDNGYPALEEHAREHKIFVERVIDYQEAVYNRYIPFRDMLDFLKNWLVEHMIGSDQKYMDYLNGRG